ncbi:hypothetical protein BMF94_5134 [Rhodotorula taiwanensis]|uniref:UBR-type domain-containing protein n=1 Tax=Rhodotorula taiwanensis TaxID=741276 RepID=A0A2S5B4R1_9BASI|nr:hypothetical protein BMF94_5134 [Rhodotorula taiwanensis]
MLNHEALLFSPTRDGVPSSDDNFYASDLIAAQDALEAEAREAVPYAAECSYDLGYIKQPLYACRTCLNYKAVCVACSVACHAEHDLIELFNRRDFRTDVRNSCDCGTEAMGAGSCCQISGRTDAPRNDRNKYDHNFRGEFCWCGRPYDPHTEENDMIQCIVCEDWCHEPCLMGRQQSRASGGSGAENAPAGGATATDDPEEDDTVLSPDDFDVLVCQRCVRSRDDLRHLLQRYAGIPGSGVVIISEDDKVLGTIDITEGDDAQDLAATFEDKAGQAGQARQGAEERAQAGGEPATSAKRSEGHDSDASDRPAKRARVQEDPAGVSVVSAPAATLSLLTNLGADAASTGGPSNSTCRAPGLAVATDVRPLRRLEASTARMNVYLQEGFMDRWCRCGECLATLIKYPYLLEEEEVYEPPEDPDASKSTFELGMEHLLTRMPRGQALDSITAFSQLSDRLKGFLRPHAEGGTTVTKEDIDRFFEAEREARAQRQL